MSQIEKTVLPKRLERTTIYESDYVCLYTDKVQLPSGYVIDKYHQLHYPHNAVSIVIFNEKNEILMIREKRYTVGRLEWEIPAGRVEDGESKENAARREAMEETGCTLKNLKFLCSQNPAKGCLIRSVMCLQHKSTQRAISRMWMRLQIKYGCQ